MLSIAGRVDEDEGLCIVRDVPPLDIGETIECLTSHTKLVRSKDVGPSVTAMLLRTVRHDVQTFGDDVYEQRRPYNF
jgi:hypothetical protein